MALNSASLLHVSRVSGLKLSRALQRLSDYLLVVDWVSKIDDSKIS
jgi:hypothetical protein